MKYAFLFVCLLFVPGISHGMEMDPEAAEEGRSEYGSDQKMKLFEAIIKQAEEGPEYSSEQKMKLFEEITQQVIGRQETTVILCCLLKKCRDELAQSEQRIKKATLISFAGGSTITFLTVTAVYVMRAYFCCYS